jgi:hypothetical protein
MPRSRPDPSRINRKLPAKAQFRQANLQKSKDQCGGSRKRYAPRNSARSADITHNSFLEIVGSLASELIRLFDCRLCLKASLICKAIGLDFRLSIKSD